MRKYYKSPVETDQKLRKSGRGSVTLLLSTDKDVREKQPKQREGILHEKQAESVASSSAPAMFIVSEFKQGQQVSHIIRHIVIELASINTRKFTPIARTLGKMLHFPPNYSLPKRRDAEKGTIKPHGHWVLSR